MIVVLRLCKNLIQSLEPVLLRQLDLVDKSTSLAAAQDITAYQAIQAMDSQKIGYPDDYYDPSDAAEAAREASRAGLDPEELSSGEQEQLRSFFS